MHINIPTTLSEREQRKQKILNELNLLYQDLENSEKRPSQIRKQIKKITTELNFLNFSEVAISFFQVRRLGHRIIVASLNTRCKDDCFYNLVYATVPLLSGDFLLLTNPFKLNLALSTQELVKNIENAPDTYKDEFRNSIFLKGPNLSPAGRQFKKEIIKRRQTEKQIAFIWVRKERNGTYREFTQKALVNVIRAHLEHYEIFIMGDALPAEWHLINELIDKNQVVDFTTHWELFQPDYNSEADQVITEPIKVFSNLSEENIASHHIGMMSGVLDSFAFVGQPIFIYQVSRNGLFSQRITNLTVHYDNYHISAINAVAELEEPEIHEIKLEEFELKMDLLGEAQNEDIFCHSVGILPAANE